MKRLKLFPIAGYYIIIILIIIVLSYFFDWWSICVGYIESDQFRYNAFASFFGGLALAFIFFFLLRPRINISPVIAEIKGDSQTYYKFKFINNSIFPAFDVKIESYISKETNATNHGEGVNTYLEPIELTRTEWMYIPGWRPTFPKTRLAPHCVTVRTFHKNLPLEVKDNHEYLIFRVTLKHAFSNLSSTYRAKYPSEGCIQKGKFKFGNSFEIF